MRTVVDNICLNHVLKIHKLNKITDKELGTERVNYNTSFQVIY